MISTNSAHSQFATVFDFPLELDPGALFSVTMNYTASDRTLTWGLADGFADNEGKRLVAESISGSAAVSSHHWSFYG